GRIRAASGWLTKVSGAGANFSVGAGSVAWENKSSRAIHQNYHRHARHPKEKTGIRRKAATKKPVQRRALNNPHSCRVELDPLNMYCYMWDLFVCFRLPVKACRPQPELIP